MSKRTPTITTVDGRQTTVAKIHPARYSDEHVELFRRLLDAESERLGRPVDALDPMCGVCTFHRCASASVHTYGSEIEQPYVDVARQLHPDRPTVCADARKLPWPDATFDAVVVSPTFGQRYADSHKAKDPCRCRKTKHEDGTVTVAELANPTCKTCHGTGISPRRGYTHDLRTLTGNADYKVVVGSTADAYAWQPRYWRLHTEAWCEVRRVLRPGGLFIVDVKDCYRTVKGVRQIVPVVAGHADILDALDFDIELTMPLASPGLRYGSNHDARVDAHQIIVARTPALVAA